METVTEVQEERNYTKVYFSNDECLLFSRSLWKKAPELRPGSPIDLKELKEWLLLEQYTFALHYAIDLLARRPRSMGEIEKKLRLRLNSEDTIEMVLYKLEKEKLVDDRSFARQYAEACVRSQYGKDRIRRALMEKGVARDVIDDTLSALEGEEQNEAALVLAQKLLRRYENEPDVRKKSMKLLAAMARRGYSYEESKAALELAQESGEA